jgi:hypothetical protein
MHDNLYMTTIELAGERRICTLENVDDLRGGESRCSAMGWATIVGIGSAPLYFFEARHIETELGQRNSARFAWIVALCDATSDDGHTMLSAEVLCSTRLYVEAFVKLFARVLGHDVDPLPLVDPDVAMDAQMLSDREDAACFAVSCFLVFVLPVRDILASDLCDGGCGDRPTVDDRSTDA